MTRSNTRWTSVTKHVTTPVALLIVAAIVATITVGVGRTGISPAAAQETTETIVVQGETTNLDYAQTASTVGATVTGHGWGHGRGMGQYGAKGYAEQGWTSAQILAHYYGNTTAGNVASLPLGINPNALRVELRANRDNPVRISLATGTMILYKTTNTGARTGPGGAPERVLDAAGQPIPPLSGAVRMFSSGGTIVVQTAASCNGPWTEITRAPGAGVEVHPIPTSTAGTDGLLRVCNVDNTSTWYEGVIRAHNVSDSTRVVNVVSLETYLKGVVPNEMPASWVQPALEAQAVAARSYVAAGDTRQQPFADTCDTTLCQVYYGRYRQGTGYVYSATNSRTNAAIDATAGVVRVRNGGVARTEFSSSTGGYTAGGTFPAVVDAGDSTAANPNHNWSTTVDFTAYEAEVGKGFLRSITMSRNGLGAEGGRVNNVTFTFANGTTTLTGNQVRSKFGLKSDWFSFGTITRTFTDAAIPVYINHVHQLFLKRAATTAEIQRHGEDVSAGRRWVLTNSLAVSNEWAGVMVDNLYRSALGRAADSGGRSYWVGRIAAGVRVETIGAQFYGSPEYFTRSGGTNRTFVAALYRNLLGREADAAGLNYWEGRLQAGMSTTQVASGFYSSIESRRGRVVGLYNQILRRNPDPAGLEYWAGQLLTTDDVRLAASLASSEELYRIAQG